jgi:uncharacterized protein YbjT (DUF2867 family)
MTNQRGHETAAKQVWGAVVGAQGLRSVSTQLCVPTYSWASGRARWLSEQKWGRPVYL